MDVKPRNLTFFFVSAFSIKIYCKALYNFAKPRGVVDRSRNMNVKAFHFHSVYINTTLLSSCVNNIAFVGLLEILSIHSSLDKFNF